VNDDRSNLDGRIRTMRVIVAAIAGGAGMALALLTVLIRPGQALPGQAGTFLLYIAAAVSVVSVVIYVVVSRFLERRLRKELGRDPAGGDTGAWYSGYQTRLLIQVSLIEAACLLWVIAYGLGRQPLAMAMALVLLAEILVHLPSRRRVDAWVEAQRDQAVREVQAA